MSVSSRCYQFLSLSHYTVWLCSTEV